MGGKIGLKLKLSKRRLFDVLYITFQAPLNVNPDSHFIIEPTAHYKSIEKYLCYKHKDFSENI